VRGRHAAAEAGYDVTAWLCGLAAGAALMRAPGAARPGPLAAAATAAAVCALQLGCGLLAGLYRGRYQRGSADEVAAVTLACCGTALGLAVLSGLLIPGQQAPPVTVAGAALFALAAMLAARYAVYAVRQRPRAAAAPATAIIVFGAGSAGTQLLHRLIGQPDRTYQPVALLDDDPGKQHLRVCGIPVLGGRAQIADAAARTGATVLVIAIARPSGTVIHELTDAAEACGLTPKVIPSVAELITGGARIEGVRDPRISDLLGRRPVTIDSRAVSRRLAGKRILVTGAGGSIGSELCRQLYRLHPAELVMLDRDESALHAVQLALRGRALLDSDDAVLADIRDAGRVRQVFEQARPQVVFHAAALKHLPLLERYPAEAVKTNVWGTQAVLDAAAACGVECFVNISTDKAADPVSVLGFTKRITERLTAAMAGRADGTYLSVRFGNVLGSRGSVLTALSAQIAEGGPVTVTHPEVRRYFMSAAEAVQLVLQAAAIGRGGEALVLDMGHCMRIADIARRMTAHACRDVEIVFTGLRPGEKLTEDLLGRDEPDHRPCHPLVMHVPVPGLAPGQLTALDPGEGPAALRAALARCASAGAGGAVPDRESGPVPPPGRRPAPAGGEAPCLAGSRHPGRRAARAQADPAPRTAARARDSPPSSPAARPPTAANACSTWPSWCWPPSRPRCSARSARWPSGWTTAARCCSARSAPVMPGAPSCY